MVCGAKTPRIFIISPPAIMSNLQELYHLQIASARAVWMLLLFAGFNLEEVPDL